MNEELRDYLNHLIETYSKELETLRNKHLCNKDSVDTKDEIIRYKAKLSLAKMLISKYGENKDG